MSARLNLKELRRQVLVDGLDSDDWRTTSEVADRLGLNHGFQWYKCALILERLVVDGVAEIKRPGSQVRRFRRAA